MTILIINTGTSANKGDGDSLRSAFQKINANFAYISTLTNGGGSGSGGTANTGDISFNANVISSTLTNENIVLDPNGSGVVSLRNTTLQFDNGTGGNPGQGVQILRTEGTGNAAGLGIDGTNSSLRVIGDKDQLGTLVDFGLYNGTASAWASKVKVDYNGSIDAKGSLRVGGALTATGVITALSGVRFPDGSTQTSAVNAFTVSAITSGTVSNILLNVDTLRFDTNSGFDVTDLGGGAVEVSMNSTFKYWEVDGQDTLIAHGLDYVRFEAGNGIEITTDAFAAVKTISFKVADNVNTGTTSTVNLGNLLVDNTTIYSSTSSLGSSFANKDIAQSQVNASFILFPPVDDFVSPAVISSPNEIRLTTAQDSLNPVTVAPNLDGIGPGYVVISANSTTNTSGVFASSATGGIDLWPNPTIVDYVYNDANVGTLDLYTNNHNNISIRPNGTGTTIVTSNLKIKKSVILNTSIPGSGAGGASSEDYQTAATALSVNAQIHVLSNGDYYLPPGTEGQVMYFVPNSNADNTVRIWFQEYRVISGMNTVTRTDDQWTPFSMSLTNQGPVYAIYATGVWIPSHSLQS
jgi:hypothetical protein